MPYMHQHIGSAIINWSHRYSRVDMVFAHIFYLTENESINESQRKKQGMWDWVNRAKTVPWNSTMA